MAVQSTPIIIYITVVGRVVAVTVKTMGIWVALMLLFVLGTAAQTVLNYMIKGIVADSLTREGEPYATLTIVRPDSADKPLKQAVADFDGKFTLTSAAMAADLDRQAAGGAGAA